MRRITIEFSSAIKPARFEIFLESFIKSILIFGLLDEFERSEDLSAVKIRVAPKLKEE